MARPHARRDAGDVAWRKGDRRQGACRSAGAQGLRDRRRQPPAPAGGPTGRRDVGADPPLRARRHMAARRWQRHARPRLRRRLRGPRGRCHRGDKDKPIVTFCHPERWGSWNTAKRLTQLGYTHVYWYPRRLGRLERQRAHHSHRRGPAVEGDRVRQGQFVNAGAAGGRKVVSERRRPVAAGAHEACTLRYPALRTSRCGSTQFRRGKWQV